MLTYWDGLIKKKLVSTIPGFSAEFYNAIGSGQIASSIEAAWGPGVLAASLNDKTSGEWRVAPLPQWGKDQPFHSGNWGGSCNIVPKQSKHLKAAILFSVWLNTAKGPVLSNWNNYGIFPPLLPGLLRPTFTSLTKTRPSFAAVKTLQRFTSRLPRPLTPILPGPPGFLRERQLQQTDRLLTCGKSHAQTGSQHVAERVPQERQRRRLRAQSQVNAKRKADLERPQAMHQHRKAALSFLAAFLAVFFAFYLTPVLRYLPEFFRPQTGRRRPGKGGVWGPGKLLSSRSGRGLP